MAIQTARQSTTFRDAKGNTARVSFYVTYDSAAPADGFTVAENVIAQVEALSNAVPQEDSGPFSVLLPTAYGAVATYEDVEDKARITYVDVAGALHHLDVPAPIGSGAGNIFLADGETVKPASLTALQTAMTTAVGSAHITNRGGQNIASIIAGVRKRTKLRRKLTIYTKSANLDEPGE